MFDSKDVSSELTLDDVVACPRGTTYHFTCDHTVSCSGETLWGYTHAGETLTITGITVIVHSEWCEVYVSLAEDRVVYTDPGFAQEVSRMLNMTVDYTEQGMQDSGMVSMET